MERWAALRAILGMAGLGAALAGAPAAAVVFAVNTAVDAADALPGDGKCDAPGVGCTLRAAVQEANATAGADVIQLPAAWYFLTLTGVGEDAAASGDLDVLESLTVQGANARTTIVDADFDDRVFDLPAGTPAPGPTLVLDNVTVRAGAAPGPAGTAETQGGGIRVLNGGLILNEVTVADSAAHLGGGVYTEGAYLGIQASTLRDNNASDADLGNSDLGGGVYVASGAFDLNNSTVSGNSADTGGGGLFIAPTVTANLAWTTVTNNVAFVGLAAGVLALAPQIEAYYSILGPNGGTDCLLNALVGDHNLDSDGTCGLLDPTDLPATDPQLRPLGVYGGPTETHDLTGTSPAVDAGPSIDCQLGNPVDQRGIARPKLAGCDIGAVERRPRSCGLGFELALALLPLAELRRRRVWGRA